MFEQDTFLKVGDIVEIHRTGNPPPHPEWQPQAVQEIRITEEYEDKDGRLVPEVNWQDIRDYQCMVIVVCTENWGRNEDVRPARLAKGNK